MVYIDRYVPIYMFKYVYVHIRVRQQLEYMLKSKTKKRVTRPFSLSWYYQSRLKGVSAGAGVPPFSPPLTPKNFNYCFNKILLSNKCLFKDF
jgi:hypothetical protein